MGLNAGLVTRMALPDAWIYQDGRSAQLKEAGLDAASIASTLRAAIDRRGASGGTGGAGGQPIIEVRPHAPARAPAGELRP